MIKQQKPRIITGYNDEVFEAESEALECAEWLENEMGDDDGKLYVFQSDIHDENWVVAW